MLLLVAVLTFSRASFAAADPVKVRYPESTTHGFLVLRDLGGKALARGELTQWPERDELVNRLVLRFDDGSLYDEQLRFSQKTVLRLLEYRLVQRGPSFKKVSEVEFDRSGRYRARQRSGPVAEEETASGTTDIPDDVYNGMTSTLFRHLGATPLTTHLLAFNPKPVLIEMHLKREGSDTYWVGSTRATAARHLAEPKVPGVKGLLATLVGKQPPSVRFWLTEGPAPTFVRFEGPLYADGPTWRIELSAPRWRR